MLSVSRPGPAPGDPLQVVATEGMTVRAGGTLQGTV